MNTLAQIVQRTQMVSPMAIDTLQKYHALELSEALDTHQLQFGRKLLVSRFHYYLKQFMVGYSGRILDTLDQINIDLPVIT